MDDEELEELLKKHASAEGVLDIYLTLFGVAEMKDGATGEYPWVLSDYSKDRDDERIDPVGWQLANYRKNPVVLWSHEWWEPAIGVSRGVKIADGQLVGKVVFDASGSDQTALLVASKVESGIIKTGSVGFRPIKIELPGQGAEDKDAKGKDDGTRLIYRKQELMEFSICNIPSNVNATMVAAELNRSAGKAFVMPGEPEEETEVVPEEPPAPKADDERVLEAVSELRAEIVALKQALEEMGEQRELAGKSPSYIDGLFAERETQPETRAIEKPETRALDELIAK